MTQSIRDTVRDINHQRMPLQAGLVWFGSSHVILKNGFNIILKNV